MTEAWAERDRIEIMIEKAEDTNSATLTYSAEIALKAWRQKYPEAAADEDAEEQAFAADAMRRKALGATAYDCDGSLSTDAQTARHADLVAHADAMDR